MSDFLIVLLLILAVILYIRGPKVLPGIGAALGRGLKDARQAAQRQFGGSGEDGDTSGE